MSTLSTKEAFLGKETPVATVLESEENGSEAKNYLS
jgi:hypothetical protein